MTTERSFDIENLPDDWESLADAGREIVGDQDRDRWMLGHLAKRVEKRYGEKSIKKFASDINLPSSKTLYDYHRVSKFYPFSVHADFPALSWSHFKVAMRLEWEESALNVLCEAEENNWPVAALNERIDEILGKKSPPRKLVDELVNIQRQTETRIAIDLGQDEISALYPLAPDRIYRLSIHEVVVDPVCEDERLAERVVEEAKS
ncbi:MAG: hypothetical protein L0Z53_01835 [Acidobacteriales bacterium]|nr:hypothetical protein [Terriglobales bacterium]